MINLEWDSFYELGVDFIDQEHKNILQIMKNIRESVNNGNLKECANWSDSLIKSAHEHFRHEEEYLDKVKFPKLEAHKIYHKGLLEQAHQVKKICEGIEKEHSLEECLEAMEKFLIDDVINGDLEFKSFLEFNGHIKPTI